MGCGLLAMPNGQCKDGMGLVLVRKIANDTTGRVRRNRLPSALYDTSHIRPSLYPHQIHPRALIHFMINFFLLVLPRTHQPLLGMRMNTHLAVRAGRIALDEVGRVDGDH